LARPTVDAAEALYFELEALLDDHRRRRPRLPEEVIQTALERAWRFSLAIDDRGRH
jgi:hypothetical protein